MQRNGRFIKLCALPITIILFACSTKPDPLCNRHHAEKSSPKCILPPPPLTQKARNKPDQVLTVAAIPAPSSPQTAERSANLKTTQTTPVIALSVREKDISPPVRNQNQRETEQERTPKQITNQVTAPDSKTNLPKLFTVQLGVYQQESHRIQAINKLGETYSPLVFPVKNKLYGLASGVFYSRTAAEKHAKLLKAMGFDDAYVRSSSRFSSK